MIEINIDVSDVLRVVSPTQTAPQWTGQVVDKQMPLLGRKVSEVMKKILRPRRYTGTLEESVGIEYDSAKKEISIGPTAKRGGYDAGLIFEGGTKRIPNVLWRPIHQWAIFRGVSSIAAIRKIQARGVSPHPFLNETLMHGDTQAAIQEAAERMGADIAAYAISGGTKIGGILFS